MEISAGGGVCFPRWAWRTGGPPRDWERLSGCRSLSPAPPQLQLWDGGPFCDHVAGGGGRVVKTQTPARRVGRQPPGVPSHPAASGLLFG